MENADVFHKSSDPTPATRMPNIRIDASSQNIPVAASAEHAPINAGSSTLLFAVDLLSNLSKLLCH